MNKQDIAEYYDEYTSRQLNAGVNKRHVNILEKAVHHGLQTDHKVLEIGCGVGTLTGILGKYLSNGSLIGLDISAKSVELANERLKELSNVECKVLDLITDQFEGKFDSIILPDVIEHIPIDMHKTLFEKISKLMHDGTNVYINIPNPYYLRWCHEHKPELLQVIDQPIFTNELLSNVYAHNLYLHFLETYSIWIDNGDYQFMVIKKDVTKDFKTIDEKVSLKSKINYKLKKLFNK